MDSNLVIIILAAGQGKRLGGESQKVVREILGKPMLLYLFNTIEKLKPYKTIVVVGYKKEEVFEQLKDKNVEYAEQTSLKGTGDAVLQTKGLLTDYKGDILILCGDVPFVTIETLNKLITTHRDQKNDGTILTAFVDNPTGYGRIKRDEKRKVLSIVEELNASPGEKDIKEINAGIYIFKKEPVFEALSKVKPDKIKNEYYLTDVVKILSTEGKKIGTYTTETPKECLGINSIKDIEEATHFLLTYKERENE
ncbi:MAG: sugar phosphate nucleotidyltransferase [Candidatus Omnitrophica bacterium]|nr:sugar phosphate nucleotidyltransferase [Candidatus Omnitrophota bacterium]MCM8777471.1 sugar phosphate nucleotidyltransferase [Candidatus Omnitrophota bacterium]